MSTPLPAVPRARRAFLLVAGALAAGACGPDPVPTGAAPDAPAPGRVSVRVLADTILAGQAGRELAEALRVEVRDETGRPVPNFLVNFRVVAGGGAVFAGAAVTDAAGRAVDRWTLGPASADTQRVEVRAVDPATGARRVFATFRAVAREAAAPVLLGAEPVRLVLTWTRGPQDLDAELDGPSPGGGRFAVNSTGPGSCSAAPFACKDRDATSTPGVETIAIARRAPGTYRYVVHNYSNEAPTDTSTRVAVYSGDRLVRTVAAPPSPGRSWVAVELRGDTLVVPSDAPPAGRRLVLVSPSPVTVAVGARATMRVRVTDGASVVAGASVRWVQEGGTPLLTTTDADGESGVVVPTERAGTFAGRAELLDGAAVARAVSYAYTVGAAPPPAAGGYRVDVRFVGAVPASLQAAASGAAARLSRVITRGVGTMRLDGTDMRSCGDWVPSPYTGIVDSHLLFVAARSIDGPGGTLAQAGPCYVARGGLAVVSVMEFDVGDLAQPQRDLDEIVLHELLHAVGVGTFDGWVDRLTGAGTPSPVFTGPHAAAAWRAMGGSRYPFAGVPVESSGGEGTADSHWSERVFGTELMTGYHDAGVTNALSAVTVGALRDIGYEVDAAAAEAFALPAFSSAERTGVRRARFEVVRRPQVLP